VGYFLFKKIKKREKGLENRKNICYNGITRKTGK